MHKRKVITRSGACVRGYFWSLKSRRLIPWESQLERDGMLHIEFDPSVVRFREYQEEVWIGEGEDAFCAYPDLWTELRDKTIEIVEVKSNAALADPQVTQRLTRIATHFERKGTRYRILAERQIRNQPRLKNLEALATFRRPNAKERLQLDADIREILKLRHSTTLGYVATRLGSFARAQQLIANGFLCTDLNLPLTPETRVSVASGAQS